MARYLPGGRRAIRTAGLLPSTPRCHLLEGDRHARFCFRRGPPKMNALARPDLCAGTPAWHAGCCGRAGNTGGERLHHLGGSLRRPLFEQFTKETGIQVRWIRQSSGVILARVIAEKGNPQAT